MLLCVTFLKRVAVKVITNELTDHVTREKNLIEREIEVMKLFDHPNIVRLLDVYETDERRFHRQYFACCSPDSRYIFLELMEGGNLADYVEGKGRLISNEALYFFQQIVEALDYCHAHLVW